MGNTIPGGYFLGADGLPHDANGRPVKVLSDKALKQAKGEAETLTDAQREAMGAQRAADQRALEAEEAAAKAGAEAKGAAAQSKAADKDAKQQAKR